MVDKIYHDHRRWVIAESVMMMMTMMMVVGVVVREDASIFINRAVDVLYFSDVHSVLSNRHIDDDGGDRG